MSANGRSRREPGASVTIEDVARLAGVSRATASRVANHSPKVNSEARAAVQAAIARLGYVPNRAARSLMTRRSDSVAVVILESATRLFEDPYFNQLLLGISGGLADHEVQLVLLIAQSAREEQSLERYIASGHVDGAMVIGPRGDDELPRRLVARGVPIVVNGRPSSGGKLGRLLPLSYVDVENREGARAAVAHLVAGGRRRIATIHGALDLSSGRDRLNGYREGLETAGLRADESLEENGRYDPSLAADAMRSLLARRPDLDAVFAASDSMAAAAIGVLIDAGRGVPEDVAVVGFDDSPVASTIRPTLTTVRQPIVAMGRQMAELLLRQIGDREGAPSRVIFPTELVVRESSAAAAPEGDGRLGRADVLPSGAAMATRPGASPDG